MNLKEWVHRSKPPCPQCPYRLGMVETLKNPCPACKQNGLEMFEVFQRRTTANWKD